MALLAAGIIVAAGAMSGQAAEEIEELRIQGENFVNGAGEPVRFWGFNVVSLYPTHAQADSIAAQLASYGVNVVRPHHTTRNAQGNWNAEWAGGSGIGALIEYGTTTRKPNREAYERFDYFNYRLRENGIYTRLTLDGTRSYLPGDVDILITDDADRKAWYEAMDVLNKIYWERARDLRRMLPTIDERAALLNEEFISEFLNHRNPYTGMTYGEDPQTLTLEAANETSAEYSVIVGNRFDNSKGTLVYSDGKTPISAQDEAKLRYWKDKLNAKWTAYLDSAGIPKDQQFDLYASLANNSQSAKLRSGFLRKLDEDYFLRIKRMVRDQLGCNKPITYSTF